MNDKIYDFRLKRWVKEGRDLGVWEVRIEFDSPVEIPASGKLWDLEGPAAALTVRDPRYPQMRVVGVDKGDLVLKIPAPLARKFVANDRVVRISPHTALKR